MTRTLNILSNIIIENTEDMTLEQIAKDYKENLNPSLLALAFKKVFKLIIHVSKNYYGLTEEDIASYALEKLDTCLFTYTENSQASFSTYYTKTLYNKFREETQSLNTHKRKALFYSDSYEVMLENGFDLQDHISDEDNFISSLREYDLTENELEYCQLILNGWINKDISDRMEISVMTLSNMRKRMRNKLTCLPL